MLHAAEVAGFDVVMTGDGNMVHQQNMSGRRLSLMVLSNPSWPVVRENVPAVIAAINQARSGGYQEVMFARPGLRRRPVIRPP